MKNKKKNKEKTEEKQFQSKRWVEEVLQLAEEAGKIIDTVELRLKIGAEEAERRIEEIRRRK